MKSIRLSILLCSALSMLACTGRKHSDFGVDIFEKSVVTPLAEGAANSIKIDISLQYPTKGVSDDAAKSMTARIIGQAVGMGDPDIERAVERYISATCSDYKATCNELLESLELDAGAEDPALNWEDKVSGYFEKERGKLIPYIVYSYIYQGGAHGDHGEYAVVFNKEDGSLVSENDFFVKGYNEPLSEMLSSHLREAMPDEEAYEALFVKDIEPNGNFYVSDAGVSYIYGTYEIGPYYLGLIRVTVPWEEVSPIVKAEYL